MLTEDYLMRIINQAMAALLKAIGLKKEGKYEEAQQALDQAFEQLFGLPTHVFKQLEDASLLAALTTLGKLDIGRLAVLADLFKEEGEILDLQGRSAAGASSAARALRLYLEVVLAEEINLTPENISKIEALYSKLKKQELPVDTQLALLDYYGRLLDRDEGELASAGTSHRQAAEALSELQDRLGPSLK